MVSSLRRWTLPAWHGLIFFYHNDQTLVLSPKNCQEIAAHMGPVHSDWPTGLLCCLLVNIVLLNAMFQRLYILSAVHTLHWVCCPMLKLLIKQWEDITLVGLSWEARETRHFRQRLALYTALIAFLSHQNRTNNNNKSNSP